MKAEWTNKDSLTSNETTGKAILVIDKPKDCFTCELGGSKVCIGGCPLKPMPEKYIEREIKIETERDVEVCTHGITLGRNLLIEEIEKC